MGSYKGIEFAKGLNVSFARFKEMFASHPVFKNIPHKQVDAELEVAYKTAVPHGNTTKPTKKSKEADNSESREVNFQDSETDSEGYTGSK